MDRRQLFDSKLSDEMVPEEAAEDNIAVFLRLRPQNLPQSNLYRVFDNVIEITGVEDAQNRNKDTTEKQFSFTKIFEETSVQRAVYDRAVYPGLRDLLNSTGATFLTYGTSGSGKTFTLMGDASSPGLIPRAICQLYAQFGGLIAPTPLLKTDFKSGSDVLMYEDEIAFELEVSGAFLKEAEVFQADSINMMKTIKSEHNFEKLEDPTLKSVMIYVSFVEIYKEVVGDLFDFDDEPSQKSRRVISNGGESFVSNANWIFAPTAKDCLGLLQYGLDSAKFGSTEINSHSSRSHLVFTVNVLCIFDNKQVQRTTYKFCDLAGSERTKKTGAAGDRLVEAKKINLSLTTLGRCLQIIHSNQATAAAQGLVPVRDSKLTLLLQSALCGTEKLTMIVNLLPSVEFLDENLNVLNFAAIAKNIVVKKAEVRKPNRRQSSIFLGTVMSRPSIAAAHEKLLDENELLREEVSRLNSEIYRQEVNLRNELCDNFEIARKRKEEFWEQTIERRTTLLTNQYEAKIARMKKRHDDDVEELEEMIDELEKKLQRKSEKLKDLRARFNIEEEDTEEEEEDVLEVSSGSENE